jgi:hypothetical protein
MIAFGPELLGRTEKTLVTLLQRNLADTGLDEQQYVTLKVASSLDPSQDLVDAVHSRAHFADAAEIVATLAERGLLSAGHLSPAGTALLDQILTAAAGQTATIWTDLPDDEVAAATRVLNTVLERAEAAL